MFHLLEMSMLGVFMSLDYVLFYVFWEISLVPMYLSDRHLGWQESQLRIGQVLHLYPDRFGGHVAGHPGRLLRHGHLRHHRSGQGATLCSKA